MISYWKIFLLFYLINAISPDMSSFFGSFSVKSLWFCLRSNFCNLTAMGPQNGRFTIIYVISTWPRLVLILMEIWNINVNSINFSFCNRICSLVGANLFPFIRLKTWVIFGLKFSFLLSGSGQSKNRFGFKRFREIERHEKNDKIRKRRRKGSLSAPIGTVLVRHFLLNRLNFLKEN